MEWSHAGGTNREKQSGQSGVGGGEVSVSQTLAGFSVSARQRDSEWARVATGWR